MSTSSQGIPDPIQSIVIEVLNEFQDLDQHVCQINKTIRQTVNAHPHSASLLALPGFGVINTLASLIVNPSDFKNGRHYSAYLGLVPRLTGTGGHIKILGMSKRGNRYHRKLLCDGARAFLNCNKDRTHPLWIWANRIKRTKGHNIAVVALANKLSKISWHVMKGEPFDINKIIAVKQ